MIEKKRTTRTTTKKSKDLPKEFKGLGVAMIIMQKRTEKIESRGKR